MSKASRAKGGAGEREVVQILRTHGWPDAKRTSDGSGQQGRGDIANGPDATHLEVKRQETIKVGEWWRQAEAEAATGCLPVVVFRRSRMPWLAVVELDELLALLRLREAS